MPELDMRSLFRAMRTLVAGALVAACLYSCRQGFSIDEGISGKAFMEAVKMGDGRKAALLIQEGVYTEVRDSKGDTPLLYCVRTGNTRLVEMLLRSGVLKDARTVNGKGALELAVDSGNMEMMSCLLDRGISPDEVCHDNNPIFLKAVRFGDMETVKLLLKTWRFSTYGGQGRPDGSAHRCQGWIEAMHGPHACLQALIRTSGMMTA